MIGALPLVRLYSFLAWRGKVVSFEILPNNTLSISGYIPSYSRRWKIIWKGSGRKWLCHSASSTEFAWSNWDKHNDPLRINCHGVKISKLEPRSKQHCFPIDLKLPFNCRLIYLNFHADILRMAPRSGNMQRFLGAFEKLWKATVSFVMSVSLSFRPHGATRLPLGRFLLNLVLGKSLKISRENSSFIKIWQE